ncbi:MAG TPA: c-type cytochrome [Candidatus Limnocylindria bacterium]|nr:c-type cytochrome [Candidatus Limnocylindria bacterium]
MRFVLPALALIGLVLLASLARPVAAQEGASVGSVERGAELFRVGCATCHGADGEGIDPWPSIADAGEAAADFQLRTGRMPFTGEPGQQAQPKPPAYDPEEIADLVAFVGSLGDGPAIPDVETDEALLPQGYELFAANCAPCHGATANGGAVGGGAIAWPLTSVDPRTVGEAMLTGPGQMPVFDLGDESIDAVATYIGFLQTSDDPGGFEIGGIGPVPEGFVAWLVGMGLLIGVVYLVGRRWDRAGHRS